MPPRSEDRESISFVVRTLLPVHALPANPANQATNFWTTAPANWAELRTQREYAHATNAVLTFVGLCPVTLALITARN